MNLPVAYFNLAVDTFHFSEAIILSAVLYFYFAVVIFKTAVNRMITAVYVCIKQVGYLSNEVVEHQ